MNHNDYLDAGFKVFGLYGRINGQFITINGKQHPACECGHPKCAAAFKHPRSSGWQHTPDWSDEQLSCMQEMGHFATGFGVLASGFLVIDVDARNGGVASYQSLCQAIPAAGAARFVVETGSGGGSIHAYFKLPPGTGAMLQTLREYPGIEFKTSGFVVGAGSLHASGGMYSAKTGHPCDIDEAPGELVALLSRPDRYRASLDGMDVDISAEELADMLAHINPDQLDYEGWIRIGMALHDSTGGDGYQIWEDWSSRAAKHDARMMPQKWHSFGRSSVRATLGTIVHYAKEGGWSESVTFVPTVDFGDVDITPAAHACDLLRPPGFVGELTRWINANCLYPREHLAVAAALVATSTICGLRYHDDLDSMTGNLLAFCVAGSGSGKESVLKCFAEIMRAAQLAPAMYGKFKSEQELYRNLLRHQPAIYCYDELGEDLSKIKNASRSGASYLEGLIGSVMSIYSKAGSFVQITGDLKEEIKAKLHRELASLSRILDDGDDEQAERKRAQIERQLSTIDQGIDAPFLSLIGFSAPHKFSELFDFEAATNGFLARAMIFSERETNPKRKPGYKPEPMPEGLLMGIQALSSGGTFALTDTTGQRIEYGGEKINIPTTEDARALLDAAYDDFWLMAEKHKETGLEAIPRRGYEIAAKVSLVLAMPGGLRTAEHVAWSVSLAKKDIETKLALAFGNSSDDASHKIAAKIFSLLDKDHAEREGVIINRLRGFDREQVKAVLRSLVESRKLEEINAIHPANKKNIVKYRIVE